MTSAVAVLTVTDVALPTVVAANSAVLPFQPVAEVSITFSEPVTAASALNGANYAVTNAAGVRLNVVSVGFLGTDLRTVVVRVRARVMVG